MHVNFNVQCIVHVTHDGMSIIGSLLFVCTHEKQPLTELWRKTVLSLQLVTIACYACGSSVCCICMHVCVFCTVQFLDDDDCTGFIEIIDYLCLIKEM